MELVAEYSRTCDKRYMIDAVLCLEQLLAKVQAEAVQSDMADDPTVITSIADMSKLRRKLRDCLH